MEKITDEKLKREFAFDRYGRYALMRNVINANRKNGETFKILDVGGRGNILSQFLPDDSVFYIDPFVESDDENFIKGDGCAMPLEDESFDWVTSGDVFEHIPKEKKEDFLKENIRVSKKGVLLAAPFFSKEVAQAEIFANDNYKTLSGGIDHRWLIEHIENSLPKEAMVEQFLNNQKCEFQKIHNNRLVLWQILLGVELLSENYAFTGDGEIKKEFEDFNYFFNTEVLPYDSSEPSYRKIYFIKKDSTLNNLEIKQRPIDDVLFLKTIKKGIDLLGKIDNKNKVTIRKQAQEIENFSQQKDQEIKNIGDVIKQKDQEINFIKSSKFWKARMFYLGLKFTIFSPGKFIKKYCKRIRGLCYDAMSSMRREGFKNMIIRSINFIVYGKGVLDKNASIIDNNADYKKWIEKNEKFDVEKIKSEITKFKYNPKISIITPVYNVDSKWLDKCIESVRDQFYENWELCLHDDASTKEETIACLKKWEKLDSRVKISYGKENQHISGASNDALKLATGEFIALLDNDDLLSPNAIYENIKLLNFHKNADLIYSDEDKLSLAGIRKDPFFKPDLSPDLLLSMNYISHLGIYRKSIIDEIGGFRKGFEGAQDYDLVLRLIEKTKSENIFHIPKILYHWREVEGSTSMGVGKKNYAVDNSIKALQEYLNRNDIKGRAEGCLVMGRFRIKRDIINNPLVSIIIPFRDQVEVLRRCVDSIKLKTSYKNYELILVDNQSLEKESLNYIKSLEGCNGIKFLQYNKAFNFSAINNFAVKHASGECVLFLNNDTEIISEEWLSSMVEQVQRDNVGAVGAKLLYPNNLVQHAGVVMGLGIAGHAFKYMPSMSDNYFSQLQIIRNYSAVTAACLLTKKSVFEKVGGFNENNLAIAYNDVDLCLKIRDNGYLIVYTPYAELYHHESLSRGSDEDLKFTNPEKYKRVISEREYMENRWWDVIKNDPYYNPNLTRIKEDFSIHI
jgi:GT2 family glycosyltransferase